MKRSLVLVFIAVAFLFVVSSCKKKQPMQQCYTCKYYSLQNCPVFYQLSTPREYLGSQTLCNMNDGLIADYEKVHTHLDTVYRGTHNDTIITKQYGVECDNQ